MYQDTASRGLENLEEFDEQFLTTTFSKFIDRLGLERF